MPSPEHNLRRASVQSQVSHVPLILTSLRTSSGSGTIQMSVSQVSRSNSGRSSKRDSVASHFQRVPLLKRASRSAGGDENNSMPLYRLYPSQSASQQDFKAMGIPAPDRPHTSADTRDLDNSLADNAVYRSSSEEGFNDKMVATYQPKRMVPHSQAVDDYDRSDQIPETGSYHEHNPSLSRRRNDYVEELQHSRNASKSHSRDHSVMSSHRNVVSKAPSFSHRPDSPQSPVATDYAYERGDRSSAESVFSQETIATSIHTLPALQTKGPDNIDTQRLEPVLEDDPRSFDLLAPPQEDQEIGMYLLERRAEQLMSNDHLNIIFDDPKLLLKFTGFLNAHRPRSIPVLIYYLDALKAIRAINYANAIAEALEPIRGWTFTEQTPEPTSNMLLHEKAQQAFDALVQEDLPAYVAHVWIEVVSLSIQRRVTGTLAPHLREQSEGLAEVFCLSDPSRTDNPIVFASEEFARMTQYGMNYTIGRNCRFLQGPRTSPHSVRRLAIACAEGREHTEVFVNYRRDGSPFMNLLMMAPLMDSRGNVRYYIGAQVDVSGLVKECSELEGLARVLEREQYSEEDEEAAKKDEFQHLSEMFNGAELDTVRKHGGCMHKEYVDDSDAESISGRRRVVLKDAAQDAIDTRSESVAAMTNTSVSAAKIRANGRLQGVYQHYLLVRPAPSLRILFTSPSLRVPGILQSSFLGRIGGSSRVRADLAAALGEGRGVTAKIRWLTKMHDQGDGEGRPRWIHCTPLLGHSGSVGVWMIILVDDESARSLESSGRRFRPAPPVASSIGGKEWDPKQHERRLQDEQVGRSPLVQDQGDEFFPSSALPPRKGSHGGSTVPHSISRSSSRVAQAVDGNETYAPSRASDREVPRKQYTYGDGL